MALINAIVVEPDGTVQKVEIENGDLKAYQRIVGGYIEGVFGPDVTIYVNEEGLIHSLPFNRSATVFANRFIAGGHALFGPALIVGSADSEGNDTHVHESVVSYYILEN